MCLNVSQLSTRGTHDVGVCETVQVCCTDLEEVGAQLLLLRVRVDDSMTPRVAQTCKCRKIYEVREEF